MDVTTAAAAVAIVEKATKGIDALRERARGSKDTELKDAISSFYDGFLDMKEIIGRLRDENEQLRRKLIEQSGSQPEARQVGMTMYYFRDEQGPYCPACYVKAGKLVLLPPLVREGRHCAVCTQFFREREISLQRQIEPFM